MRAVERGQARVLVGRDARQAAWLERLLPVRYWKLIGRGLAQRVRERAAPAA